MVQHLRADAISLVLSMLQTNPLARISIGELAKHSYFGQLGTGSRSALMDGLKYNNKNLRHPSFLTNNNNNNLKASNYYSTAALPQVHSSSTPNLNLHLNLNLNIQAHIKQQGSHSTNNPSPTTLTSTSSYLNNPIYNSTMHLPQHQYPPLLNPSLKISSLAHNNNNSNNRASSRQNIQLSTERPP